MRLDVRNLGAGLLELESHTLRTENRPRIAILDPTVPRQSEFVVVCSWCKKFKGDGWQEVEDYLAANRIFEADQLPSLSHGICENCQREVMAQFLDA